MTDLNLISYKKNKLSPLNKNPASQANFTNEVNVNPMKEEIQKSNQENINDIIVGKYFY